MEMCFLIFFYLIGLVESTDFFDTSQDLHRFKRNTGTALGDMIVNLTLSGSTTSNLSAINYGDVLSYNVIIDLPAITTENSTDLKIDIFAISGTTGVGGFCICQPKIDSFGTNVAYDSSPTTTFGKNSVGANIRAQLTISEVNTGGTGDSGLGNTIAIEFNAVLCNLPEVTPGATFYVTVGVNYANEAYVWVGQTPVSVQPVNQTYETEASLGYTPNSVKKGRSFLATLTSSTTMSSGLLSLEVFQAQGYSDIFTIGDISVAQGSGFYCVSPTDWVNLKQLSPSGLSVSKYTFKNDFITNVNQIRDVTLAANSLTFRIPVAVMNLATVYTNVVRDLALVLTVGNQTMFAGVISINITAPALIPAGADVTIGSIQNTANNNSIYPGDSAIFVMNISVPSGLANFNFVLTGTSPDTFPVLVRPISAPNIGYIPQWYTVMNISADKATLNANFGTIENLSSSPTNVLVEIAFMTNRSIATGSYSVGCKIGAVTCSPAPSIVVIPINATFPNITSLPITVVANNFSINPKAIQLGGEICVHMNISLPPGSASDSLRFEVIPDYASSLLTRACAANVVKIGPNLPCLAGNMNYGGYLPSLANYSSTLPGSTLNDYASLDLKNTCPTGRSTSASSLDNQLVVRGCIELPQVQSAYGSGNLSVNFGLRQDDSAIWILSGVYPTDPTNTTVYTTKIVSGDPTQSVIPYVLVLEDRASIDSGRANQFMLMQSFQLDFLIKIQPQTFGAYDFTVAPTSDFRLCRIMISHVGKNFPCTKIPGSISLPTDDVSLAWVGTPYACGSSATFKFRSLTNWGTTPIVPDLISDDDSIMVTGWFQVCPTATAGGKTIPSSLKYGSSFVQTSTSVIVISSQRPLSTTPITSITYESTLGPDDEIYTGIPKSVRFNITIPPGFQNDVTIQIWNNNFAADNHVDFCNIQLVGRGFNIPCVHPNNTALSYSTNTKIFNNQIVYDYFQLVIYKVCYALSSPDPADSLIFVEAGFRVKDSVPIGTTLNIGYKILVGNTETFSSDLSLLVVDINTVNLTLSPFSPSDIGIYVNSDIMAGITMTVGSTIYVPFLIQTPPNSIFKLELAALATSVGGRPLAYISDVIFDDCGGKSTLCANPFVDLKSTFPVNYTSSGNAKTFMATDSVRIDFGYMMNAGYSFKWGENTDADNQFGLSVGIQLGDSDALSHLATTSIYLSIKVDDSLVLGNQLITVWHNTTSAKRQCCERANIITKLTTSGTNATVYNPGDLIWLQAVFYHNFNSSFPVSKSEGWPNVNIRVIAPSFVQFIIGTTNFTTNYTNGFATVLNQSTFTAEIQLSRGLLFPDFVGINISLIVDPDRDLPIGSGMNFAPIVVFPACQQSSFAGFPKNSSVYVNCGGLVSVTTKVMAFDCSDLIPITNECQITASSKMSNDTNPFYAIDSVKAWSPALRVGSNWEEYIQFNFNRLTRIRKIYIGTPSMVGATAVRKVISVSLFMSQNCKFFTFVNEVTIPSDNMIVLTSAIETVNLRIVVSKADETNSQTNPVAINGIKFYGCPISTNNVSCCPDTTVDSSNVNMYRHFIVDTVKSIVYFCDLQSYDSHMMCYSTSRKPPVVSNTWTILPGYITNIIGFSPSTGLTYFKKDLQFFATSSGQYFEMATPDDIPSDLIPPVVVPGFGASSSEITYPTTTLKANFDGLWDGNNLLVEWKPCCGN